MTDDEYFDDDEFRELLYEYEQAVRSGQPVFMDADDLGDVADYYQQHGRYDEAQAALERAAELQPDSVVALNFKMHNAINEGDYDAAEAYLEQIADHDLPEYVYGRAELWMAQGEEERADNYLRDNFSGVSPEEYQDYVLDVVNLYSDYGYNEKAMEWMMRARPDDSDDFKELMAHTLFGLGKYDDSERIFKELIDRDPFQKRYWSALANTQFMKEEYGESVSSSEYAIAIDPSDAEGLLAKANGLFRLDNFDEALTYYQRYGEQEPDDEFGLLHQGTCLISLDRCEEAAAVLQTALKVAPGDSPYLVEILQELAFAYSDMEMPETALYYLDRTDELDCDHVDMLVIKGHILLANGRTEQAEDMFRQAIIKSDNSPRTMMRVIVSLYDNQYVEASYQAFLKYFKMVPADWNEGYAYMALVCHSLKRYDEFLDYLREACRRNAHEAQLVLGHLFPDGVTPAGYYDFMEKQFKDNNNQPS